MRRNNLSFNLQECFSQLEATVQSLNGMVLDFLPALLGQDDVGDEGPSRREEFRIEIRHLRRLLRIALGNGVAEDLFTALDALLRRRQEFERAFVVWIDLIEVLTQRAEQRYGQASGLGEFKREEVKEVFRRLLGASKLRIPNVPDILRPVLIDVFVDWLVDTVVLVANQYGLWKEIEPRRRWLLIFRARLKKTLLKIVRPIWQDIAHIIATVWNVFRTRVTLSPEVLKAVMDVEREGLIASEKDLITSLVRSIEWIGAHRKELIASLELVFAAVQEAESYFSLSGPEKKAYARDLVLAVLDELGFKTRVGLLFAVVDSILDGTIEAAVHLFNKRGVFSSR